MILLLAGSAACLLFGSSLGLFLWRHHRGRGITLMVPFRSDGPERVLVWQWLRAYWKHELPGAQVSMGSDDSTVFCKTAAVNRAFRKAHGDIVVILDADAYLPGDIILDCARRIRSARRHGKKLWFVPYRHFYRLTEEATGEVLASDPDDPLRISDPPPPGMTEDPVNSSSGHWWGALILIMPREAFEAADGMDERFRGWGSEDASLMVAVDTLYASHRTTRNGVLHLWHPSIRGAKPWERMWEGQTEAGLNNVLATRYADARGRAERMRKLTREPGANG